MRYTSSLPTALLLACAAPAVPPRAPVVFPPVPSGYDYVDGAILAEQGSGHAWSLDSVMVGGRREIWFGVRPEIDLTPLHSRTLLDSLVLPSYGPDQVVILGDCRIGVEFDYEVIVLADRPRTDSVTVVHHAWRADRRRGRIVPISSRGITCWMAQPTFCGGADLSGTDTIAIAGRCAAAFVERNWFTQRRGVHPDEIDRDVGEMGLSWNEMVNSRHATLEPEPESVSCHPQGCSATFRYFMSDDCASRLVTMDRDFTGLRIWHQDLKRTPGDSCEPPSPPIMVPHGLADSAAAVLVLADRAGFFFPVTADTLWEWLEQAGPIQTYAWGVTVQGHDTLWLPGAKVFRSDHPRPFRSLKELVTATYPILARPSGGHFLLEVPEGKVSARVIDGRVVLILEDLATVARVFQARPDSVRVGRAEPSGTGWERWLKVLYDPPRPVPY